MKKTKRKVGRPAKSKTEKMNRRFVTTLTTEQHESVLKCMKENHMNASEFIREVLLTHIGKA